MAKQSQPFRFRLPWLIAPPPPRAPVPPRTPSQQVTAIPIQLPPFRPPGTAPPPQTQRQPQPQPTTDSQPPQPSTVAASQLPSQPPSPSRNIPPTPRSQTASQPPSPSPTAPPSPSRRVPPLPSRNIPPSPRSQTASQPPSPSPTAPPSPSRKVPPSPRSQTASQPPSPSRMAPPSPSRKVPPSPRSQTVSQPPSPSRMLQPQPVIQKTSSPPSPSSKAAPSPPPTVSQTASQPPSPSPPASPQTLETTTQSPSRTALMEQPKAQARSQPPLPTQQAPPSLPTTQASSPPSPFQQTPQPPSPLMLPAAQDEPALPHPPSQKPESLVKTSSTSVPPSPNQNLIKATTRTDEAAKQPPQASPQLVTGAPSSKEVEERTLGLQTPPPKAEETKTEQEKNEETRREEKPSLPADEEPKQRTVTEQISMASGLSMKIKGQPSTTPQLGQKQLEKQAALDGKATTKTGSKERESKVVAAYPKEKSMGSESRPKSTALLGERGTLQREIKEDISKFVHKLAMGDPIRSIDEKPATVITLAGENRGAAMHIGSESAKREGSVHIHRGYKLDQNDNDETTTDGEGHNQRRVEDQKTGEDTATSAYINSNVQSINNSIILNSSFGEKDPGVHLVLSNKPKEPIKMEEERQHAEASKAEFSTSPAQKFTYEPTVRRRCLRGLFLEPSDTDENNPEKPRRHGCRYSCVKEEDKGKKTEASP